MRLSLTNARGRSFRDRGASALRRSLAAAAIAVVGALAVAAPAVAEDAGPAAPVPPGNGVAVSIPAPGGFSPTSAVTFTGTRDDGDTVKVLDATGATLCSDTQSGVSWTCVSVFPNGHATATVQEYDGSAADGDPVALTFDVLGAPTLDGSAGAVTSGLVSGHGYPGSTVTTIVDGAANCAAAVSSDGFWSCGLTVASGQYTVQARQASQSLGNGAYSSLSGSLDLTVDKIAPPSAVVSSPRNGSRLTYTRITFAGQGEDGATVDLYVDNTPACTAQVSGTTWNCTATLGDGVHSVLAVQRDAAGNYAAPSAAIRITVTPRAGSTPPPPPPSGTPSAPPQTPTPTPSIPAPPPPSNPPPPRPPADPNASWGAPTTFGATLPTPAELISHGNWIGAPIVALGFILLIALPLRLLVTALRGRVRMPALKIMGRNQPAAPPEPDEPPRRVNPWISGILPLAAAAAFIVVAIGFTDQVRYLRLLAAIALGLAVLNVVVVAASVRLGLRLTGMVGRLRFLPVLLVAAILAALLSRWTGVSPPVVLGVLIGVGFAQSVPARPRAMVSLIQLGSVTVVALVAWLLHAWLGPVDGFVPCFVSEALATIALAGLGSAMVLVLPVATLPGRVLLEWSRKAWLATVAVVAVLAAAIVLGGTGARFPVVSSLFVAFGFAAISIAVWSWLRFVEPAEE